jgi:hypothetical protein
MRVRALIGATLVAFAGLQALALVASADEDPPLRPVDAGPPLRPPLTVLRAAVTAPPAPMPSVVALGSVAGPKRELIVLVGGLGTDNGPGDNPFKELQARLPSGTYDVLRFGTDFGVYDTYAPIDDNARRLRDSVRSVSGGYDATHIVAHSLGGNVADQAFALGLSSSDGVTTYIAWSAPHDGAHGARLARTALTLSGPARDDTRNVATFLRLHDPETAAVRDLASIRAIRPPAGVVRLDLRLATDVIVSATDARDPGVDSRVLLPGSPWPWEWEGHGGILQNDQALDLTLATIKQKAVPTDDRGFVLRAASEVISERVSERVDALSAIVFTGLCGIVLVGGFGALMWRTLSRRLPWPPLSE